MVAIQQPEAFRFMSLNLRYDSQPDGRSIQETINNLPDPLRQRTRYYNNTNERPWSDRRIAVANEVLFNNVDLIGFQEALDRQVKDLHQLLGTDDWGWVGVGRDDGDVRGEYSPIFYKKSKFILKDWDTFWLSDRPFACGSKYRGAGSVRICTVARFTTSFGGKLTVMATHWDDQSDPQRQLAASLVLHRAHFESINYSSEVFLLGDFNSPATGRDSAGYSIMTGSRQPVEISREFKEKYPVSGHAFTMIDFLSKVSRHRISGNHATYTGFSSVQDFFSFSRIDFIMGSSTGKWEVKTYRVGQTLYDDGMYYSDHRPVFSDVNIETSVL